MDFTEGGNKVLLIEGAIKGLASTMALGNSQESTRMTLDILILEHTFLLALKFLIHTSFLSVLNGNVTPLKITSLHLLSSSHINNR